MSISRRQFVSVSLVLAGGVRAVGRLPLGAQAPAPQAPPVTRFEEIRRGVGYFAGNGGTIGYLVNGDGGIAIDSQFMPTAEICVAGLKQRAPKGLEMLINTHHHGDHTSGNAAFRPVVKRILAHENCVAWQRKVAEQAAATPPAAGAPPPAPPVYADATFKDTWTVDFGGENVHVRYFGPGHTSGDALFSSRRPTSSTPATCSSVASTRASTARPAHRSSTGESILQKMIRAHGNDTAFVFGHGKDGIVLGTKADVDFFRDYLAAALAHVRAGIKAGQSKEEIAKVAALKGFEDVAQVNPRIALAGCSNRPTTS